MAIALVPFFCLGVMAVVFAHYIFRPFHKEPEPYIVTNTTNWVTKNHLQEIYYPHNLTIVLFKGRITHALDTKQFYSRHFRKVITLYNNEQAKKYIDNYYYNKQIKPLK